MRPPPLRTIASLGAGVVMTAGVAISSAVFEGVEPSPSRPMAEAPLPLSRVIVLRVDSLAATRLVLSPNGAGGPPGDIPAWSLLHDYPAARGDRFIEDARGFPARALTWSYDSRVRSAGPLNGLALESFDPNSAAGGVTLPFGVRAVPLGVVPAGFALDVLFWGTLAYATFALLAWRRRSRSRRRLRSRQCVACGHPHLGEPACPECGHPHAAEAG